VYQARQRTEYLEDRTPNPGKYEILDARRVGGHLVLKVRYLGCNKCYYGGAKVMVFLNVSEVEVIRWRRIDPHFIESDMKSSADEAPSPAARFPASDEGWADAIEYAQGKSRPAQRR